MPIEKTGARSIEPQKNGQKEESIHRIISDSEIVQTLSEHPQGLTPKEFIAALPKELRISDRRAQERLKQLFDNEIIEREKSGRAFIYRAK